MQSVKAYAEALGKTDNVMGASCCHSFLAMLATIEKPGTTFTFNVTMQAPKEQP